MGSQGDWRFLRSKRQPPPSAGPPVRLVDLFAGCGGMTLGVTEAIRSIGMSPQVVLAMEVQPEIRAIYDSNFDSHHKDLRGDVRERFGGQIGSALTTVEKKTLKGLRSIDILIGGPPCQGHSSLNNHTRRHDPKNSLYLRMIRAAEVIEPQALLIENVPDVRHDSDGVVQQATHRLRQLGYQSIEFIVAAARLGVAQLRSRHLLIATRSGQRPAMDHLRPYEIGTPRSLRWAIGDLVDEAPSHLFSSPAKLSPTNHSRARFLLRHDEFDLPNRLRPPCHRDKPSHSYKSMYGRMSWHEPAQTITTGFGSPGQGRYLHPEQARTITPHEAARLQFFPDWFDFSKATTRTALRECIGNAVPSKVAFCLGRLLLSRASNAAISDLAV